MRRSWGQCRAFSSGSRFASLRTCAGALVGTSDEMIALAKKNAEAAFGWPRVPHLPGERLPCERAQRHQSRAGGVPHLLRHRQPHGRVIVAETEQGRGILGVIDGLKTKGVETEADIKERKELLRRFGYKLSA